MRATEHVTTKLTLLGRDDGTFMNTSTAGQENESNNCSGDLRESTLSRIIIVCGGNLRL